MLGFLRTDIIGDGTWLRIAFNDGVHYRAYIRVRESSRWCRSSALALHSRVFASQRRTLRVPMWATVESGAVRLSAPGTV